MYPTFYRLLKPKNGKLVNLKRIVTFCLCARVKQALKDNSLSSVSANVAVRGYPDRVGGIMTACLI